MNIIKTVLLQLILVFVGNVSKAQCDCLEPMPDLFHIDSTELSYYSSLKSIFFDDNNYLQKGNYLVLPSFEPECALEISIDKSENKSTLIYKIASENIWFSKNRSRIKVVNKYKEIDVRSAELICTLFKSAISQAKFLDNHPVVPDGTRYYFYCNRFGPNSGGSVCSPQVGSKMSKLVKIGIELMKFTNSTKGEVDAKLLMEIESLQSEINDGR